MTPLLHPNPHKKKQLVIKQIPQKERQLHNFMFDHFYKKHKNKKQYAHTQSQILDCRTLITNSQKQRNEYLTTIREHQFAGNYQNGIPKSGNLSIAVDYRKPIANLMPL